MLLRNHLQSMVLGLVILAICSYFMAFMSSKMLISRLSDQIIDF